MTLRSALLTAVALSGCVAEVTYEEEVAGAQEHLRTCYPARNHYNCRPVNDCPDFRRVCEPRRDWPIDPGTPLVDGLGGSMGTVVDPTVRINYGVRKELDGETLVYTWAVRVAEGGLRSGWIPESSVVHVGQLRAAMGSSRHRDPGQGDYETVRTVTGGDTARHASLKIQPNESRGGRNATDYLMRPGGVVNLLYSVPGRGLGGHSIDTFPTGVQFHRAQGVRQVVVPLYPAGSARAADALHFIYGWIHDGRQRRYGWMAEEAMVHSTAAPPPPPGADNCWVRCCDGSLHYTYQPNAAECRGWYGVCADRGRVLRMRHEGTLIYEGTCR